MTHGKRIKCGSMKFEIRMSRLVNSVNYNEEVLANAQHGSEGLQETPVQGRSASVRGRGRGRRQTQRVRGSTRSVPPTRAVVVEPETREIEGERANVSENVVENEGLVASEEEETELYDIGQNFRYSLVRDVLRMNTLNKFDGITASDIDDWFEQFHAVVDDVNPSDKELVYMLKNLMKGAALTCLKVCQGQSFKDHRDVLTRKYRGPGYKWTKLHSIVMTSQKTGQSIDLYYQSLESNIQKAEQFMEDFDSTDYKIPQQLLVQLFVSGLKSNTIKQKLYAMEYRTVQEYFAMARILESSLVMNGDQQGSKRPYPNQNSRDNEGIKKPRADKSKITCYGCGEKGHYKRECTRARPNLSPLQLQPQQKKIQLFKSSVALLMV